MDMRLRSDAVWFRPMRCRPESLWDCVFKGYPITAIGRSGVPDFGHCSVFYNHVGRFDSHDSAVRPVCTTIYPKNRNKTVDSRTKCHKIENES